MDIGEALILGIIQGITEWLPISSEGIITLVLINFFDKSLTEAIPLAIWLHLGTFLSALVYFRKEVKNIVSYLPRYRPYNFSALGRLTNFLLLASVLTGIVGGTIYFLGIDELNIQGHFATALIGGLLLITGILQLIAKKGFHKKPLKIKDGILVGLLQGLAILPGISRSGTTSSVLLLQKYTAKDALRLSFLLSIPAVFMAIIVLSFSITFTLESLISTVVAFLVGLLSIHYLMKLAEKINFGYFCLFLGLLSLSVLI